MTKPIRNNAGSNVPGRTGEEPFGSTSLMDEFTAGETGRTSVPRTSIRERIRRGSTRASALLLGRTAIISGSLLLVAGLTVGVIRLIPTEKPDPWAAEVDDVAGFVFDADFNRLPPRERLGFLVDLIKRFRDFDQDDALALSNLLAQMNDAMRAQIEENVRRLAVDLMSESAREYADLSPEERAAYLNRLLLEVDALGDDVTGRERDETPEERLARMQRQAERDQQRAQRRGGDNLQPERVQGFFQMYQEASAEVGAVDRGKIAVLMRDMSRHLRGESLTP